MVWLQASLWPDGATWGAAARHAPRGHRATQGENVAQGLGGSIQGSIDSPSCSTRTSRVRLNLVCDDHSCKYGGCVSGGKGASCQ